MRMKSRRTLAVLLSMILLLALAPSGFAVDLEAPNTLTVNLAPADSGFAEDLAAASIQADLYLLAPATAAGTDVPIRILFRRQGNPPLLSRLRLKSS